MKYATGASTPIISVANIGKIEIPLYDAATQRELEEKAREIEKIVLYDDVHAASGWDILKDYIDIPIEYTLIERLKDNKSLADIKVTAGICKEYYENDVDSIILVSSDSDYWGLIETVPQIRFLVMVEHEKCSSAMKGALLSKNIYDIMEETLLRTRIRMNMEEKESFIKKHFTNIELVVDRQGNINLSLK